MKKIEAIIRPEKLDEVRQALESAGCCGMMITEIEGHGKQKGVVRQWRGEKYKLDLLPKTKIEVVVKDSEARRILKVIIESAQTGEIGDGKIFVSNIENAVRIRTNEQGENVL
ncbi:MAG: P-II family nitrogen regulator [Candidatus Omnitrophica bacterium]|nr:P-II family nitrogen regulator [Candidatus Omnitrophota bacterium]